MNLSDNINRFKRKNRLEPSQYRHSTLVVLFLRILVWMSVLDKKHCMAASVFSISIMPVGIYSCSRKTFNLSTKSPNLVENEDVVGAAPFQLHLSDQQFIAY